MIKEKVQHTTEMQRDRQYDNFIQELSAEVNEKQSLSIIENAMWSMRFLIIDNKKLEQKTRDDYEQLFRIAIPRLEQIISVINNGLR